MTRHYATYIVVSNQAMCPLPWDFDIKVLLFPAVITLPQIQGTEVEEFAGLGCIGQLGVAAG